MTEVNEVGDLGIPWDDAPRFGRRTTILRTLRSLALLCGPRPVIVEAGCLRSRNGCESDGWSTVAFAWYASHAAGSLTTIERDEAALSVCRDAISQWQSATRLVHGDAVDVLSKWDVRRDGEIDLLYLDSLDLVVETTSETQCLREAEAARGKLSPRALVLIDDVRIVGPPHLDGSSRFAGKGALAIPMLCGQGLRLEWCFEGQALLATGLAATKLHEVDELGAFRPSRFMWSSNAPWVTTGYGVQTRAFVPRLRAQGHEIAIHCNYGLDSGSIGWEGIPLYPRGEQHAFGHDMVEAHASHFRAEFVLFLGDAWVTDLELLRSDLPFFHLFPVDSYPIAELVADRVRRSSGGIAFSRFGVRMAAEAGLEVDYVPLAVDTSIYRPMDRAAARAAFGLPKDAFVVGMVAANKDFPSRKAFPQVFLAFAEFRRRHPDALLYVHSQTWSRKGAEGTDLVGLARALGIEHAVRFADPYAVAMGLKDEQMAALFSAFDVLASPSLGEGFGVPILEAQACGCLVIVGDWTSMPDLCFAGVKISMADADPFWTPLRTFQFVPRHAAILDALEHVHSFGGRPGFDAATARNGAMAYDADHVTRKFWGPALRRIAARIDVSPRRGG